ncbi:DUF1800 domain-containing protein [Thermomonas paludicola]|uniref:DUF1800 domain-containing protein n=1 Tax=Thermomonas paludicola TaxID=2884874 RepID=UPI0021145C91|nr:DUF1800 domain-containing protein [Thermomonas paludicola]
MAISRTVSAANRFGLGARAGELQRIGNDPRGWLLAQLGVAQPIDAFAGLPDSAGYLDLYVQVQKQRKQMRELKAAGDLDAARRVSGRDGLRRAMQQELLLRQGVAVASEQGFRERLVRFWSNHFAISVDKHVAALFAAPMEREAIRPHVGGRFVDMLLAVERHPGMLLYLDNAQSIGDDSRMATRRAGARKRGLNENLAREIMELHTLGVNAGYSQQDVTEFARAITGWSVARPNDRGSGSGAFVFRATAHEPGARRVFGSTYRQPGEEQGVAILHDLARHPATARHVSMKLARHFVADAPAPALVERMARAWLASDGDLAQVCRTMVEDDRAWVAMDRKFKTPEDFCVSALRACGLDGQRELALSLRLQGQLGQPVFQPRSPAGFGDVAADWGGPDALFKRVQAAQTLAERLPTGIDLTPQVLGDAVLGSALDAQTATALRRAESVQQGVALLLASPAFQWRT